MNDDERTIDLTDGEKDTLLLLNREIGQAVIKGNDPQVALLTKMRDLIYREALKRRSQS